MEQWKEYRLGDIALVKGGKRLPKGVNLITIPNLHPYIRVRDLGSSKYLELNSSYEYVDEETQQSISRYIVNTGDIIISIVGTIGLIASDKVAKVISVELVKDAVSDAIQNAKIQNKKIKQH